VCRAGQCARPDSTRGVGQRVGVGGSQEQSARPSGDCVSSVKSACLRVCGYVTVWVCVGCPCIVCSASNRRIHIVCASGRVWSWLAVLPDEAMLVAGLCRGTDVPQRQHQQSWACRVHMSVHTTCVGVGMSVCVMPGTAAGMRPFPGWCCQCVPVRVHQHHRGPLGCCPAGHHP
jgi:hypothetical protein